MAPWRRRARVAATVVLVSLTLLGSARGTNDDFPFGPLSMYAQARNPDAPVNDTWPWAVDATGNEFRLSQRATGVRRAEIEGQLATFRDHPERLVILADAYAAHRPDAPRVVRVEIRTRRIEMRAGKPTGRVTTVVRVGWER